MILLDLVAPHLVPGTGEAKLEDNLSPQLKGQPMEHSKILNQKKIFFN
jgi:hypothetical protein